MKVFLAVLALFFVSTVPVQAALVTVTTDGRLISNVLSAEDARGELEVKHVAQIGGTSPNATVSLSSSDGSVNVTVEDSNGKRVSDVTNYEAEVIEIEEQSTPKTVSISINGDTFTLSQGGVQAVTSYPIEVNAAERTIGIETESGEQYIGVLPADAFTSLVNANIISETDGMHIVLGEEGQLLYRVDGKRVVNVFNVMDLSVEIKADVSAANGKIINIDQPKWLTLFGFLFT